MSSESLRNAMVDRFLADQAAEGGSPRPEVEAAMRAVPREVFTPGLPLEQAYENEAVLKKMRGDEAISSVSAPFLIGRTLGQAADALDGLDGLDGRHVLEIGSGGYNASLLRELVGPAGSVTTVDIDPEVTDRAISCLTAAGYDDVTVLRADAEHPIPPGRTFDLIIVTVGAWDIPPAWLDQLTDKGVLVLPLRTFGMTRSWALRRHEGRLTSVSQRLCGFVSMQGTGAREVRYVDLADGVHLRLDEGQDVDPAAITDLLTTPREQAWAGVSLPPRTDLSDLDLWLAARPRREAEQFVVLAAQEEAVTAGIVTPSWRFAVPATLEAGTLAYRSALRWTDRRFDLGACAHGTGAAAAAGRMAEHLRAWVDAGCPHPVLHVLPAHTPDGDLPDGAVLDKRHSRLVLTFTTDEKGI
ncbi:methyltransferase, FxLD system [Parafrankia sp. FMc2]|uniref:methyltransferase, FxLD system n=1 Tax=Parafrankia sp. FMc2 TaxID=3233196 RepID=UPI0034D4861F